jgi:hypothetical protein
MKKTAPQPLVPGTRVRLTDDYLQSFSPVLRRAHADRIGSVMGYRMGAIHPTLVFPKEGRRIERKLFEVEPKHFVVVSAP